MPTILSDGDLVIEEVDVGERKEAGAPHLTSDDLCRALFACAHAITWCKAQGRSKYMRQEQRKYEELVHKINRAADHLNPYVGDSDSMPGDWGGDPIYAPMSERQQRAAIARAESRS